MTLNFPSSPTNGQTYSLANGATYTWDGEKWKASNIPDSSDVVQTTDTPANGEFLKWNNGAAVWDDDNNTNTTYTQSSVADGDNVNLRLTAGGSGSGNDDILLTAGSNITFSSVTAAGFTIASTDTTYGNFTGADANNAGSAGLVPAPASTNYNTAYLRADGTWQVPPDTDTTYSTATSSTAGIFKVIDEDDMASNVDDAVPTQQSVKKYVDDNTGSGGGLTEFTEADSEAAPNATVHVSSLTSNAGSNNADVAIVPKGTGALLAAIPDSAVTGGTKRGEHAVDLQTHRSASDMVCAANYSVIGGGTANKIVSGGGNNVIAGGYQNEIGSNVYQGTISGGRFGDATGSYGTVLGGNGATAVAYSLAYTGFAGASGSICLGDSNVNATYATCIGGNRGATKGRYGAFVIPAGDNSSNGDAQYQIQNVKKQTTDATQTTLSAETQASSASVFNTFQLHPNEMHVIKGTCVAAKSDYSLTKAWDFTAVVKWENNANAPVIVGTPNINVLIEETNSATWDIALDILTYSTAVASFVVKVTGQANTNIDWLCTLHSTELNTL